MNEKDFFGLVNDFLPLPEDIQGKMWQAFLAFQEQATQLNLTGLKTEPERVIKLFVDSLGALKFFDFSEVKTVCDLGTGGGFPGIPLAIVLQQIEFTLVDSTQKKINAVSTIIEKTGLKNAKAEWIRSEDMVKHKRKFEVVTTKALASFYEMLDMSLPLVAPQGSLIAYVGPNELPSGSETQRILENHEAEFTSAHTYELPEGMGERQIFVIAKRA
jgi:16S rRNA (guanine527-N7)-methyltransferase